MLGYNCIMVLSRDRRKILFCKRNNDPYKGLYNLVGGKIEKGETGYDAAYRELAEETGISQQYIKLHHMMDFTYYNNNCYVEVYVGILNCEIILQEEAHPLVWLDETENFFDTSRFAGEGNIGHIVEQIRCYGMGNPEHQARLSVESKIDRESVSIGVDGCKGGWIAAILHQGKLIVDKFTSFNDIVKGYPSFDEFLVDMVIGLPSNQEHVRPDTYARKIIRERTSTIFPAPCRQAVYAETVAQAYDENVRVLSKKFTPLTVGIIPKMREIDTFLQEHSQYKNVIKESHPEVCFAMLNGKTVLSKKNDIDGMEERILILRNYISEISLNKVATLAKNYKCNADDIIDAICLAVTANLAAQGEHQVIPEHPMEDGTGLKMQMIIPMYGDKDI